MFKMIAYTLVFQILCIGLASAQETNSQSVAEFIASVNQAASRGFVIPDHTGNVSVGSLDMTYSLRESSFDNIKIPRVLFSIDGDIGTVFMRNITARAFGDIVAKATITTAESIYKFEINAKYVLTIDRSQQTYTVDISRLTESIMTPIECKGIAQDLEFRITDIEINPNTLLALSLAMRQAMYADLEMMTCLYTTLEIEKGSSSLLTLGAIYNFQIAKSTGESRDVPLNF